MYVVCDMSYERIADCWYTESEMKPESSNVQTLLVQTRAANLVLKIVP